VTVLGPVRCQGCGKPVEYRRARISADGRESGLLTWRNAGSGREHFCGGGYREKP
jgi:hypothetical protein